jgi:hypothetical protein
MAIEVEPCCRSVGRSISGRGPKGELDVPIVAESKIVDIVRRLKLMIRLIHDSYQGRARV